MKDCLCQSRDTEEVKKGIDFDTRRVTNFGAQLLQTLTPNTEEVNKESTMPEDITDFGA